MDAKYTGHIEKLRCLFDELHAIAKGTELEQLTMDDIIAEVKAYRLEKKLGNDNNYPLTSAPSL